MILDILSIVLGAVAMLIPVLSIAFHKKLQPVKWWSNLSILLSMGLCALAIAIQVYSIMLLQPDIEDIIDVLTFVCFALLCIVAVLNVIYIIVHAKRD